MKKQEPHEQFKKAFLRKCAEDGCTAEETRQRIFASFHKYAAGPVVAAEGGTMLAKVLDKVWHGGISPLIKYFIYPLAISAPPLMGYTAGSWAGRLAARPKKRKKDVIDEAELYELQYALGELQRLENKLQKGK